MSETKTRSLPVINHRPKPYDGPSRDEVIALRQQFVSPGVITYYRDPLIIVEGHMQYVYDETGTRYLDAFAGIVTISVGHCHPSVSQVKAGRNAAAHDDDLSASDDCKVRGTIGQKMPAGLDKTYFTNGQRGQ